MNTNVIIIGGGIAGLNCAENIRKLNKNASITIVGKEPYLTYSRPMISKAPLVGFDLAPFLVHSANWYADNNIVFLPNTQVINLNTDSKCVELSTGEVLPYDKCVLATGAESFRPPMHGADKKGVFVIRTIDDIANMRAHCLKTTSAVVVGGGVIGLEIAWELHKRGVKVTVLERESVLMERLLDKSSSMKLQEIIEAQGITVYTHVETDALAGDDAVKQVVLKDGKTILAELVVLSCGVKANTQLAVDANIKTERAIVVDEKMQTSQADIYACGDCAQFNGVNLALWDQSVKQSEVVAKNICGENAVYTQITSAVILNGFHSSLFAVGDVGKKPDTTYTELVFENRLQNNTFMVNQKDENLQTYEKYFFVNDVIVGGVIIGDLSPMSILENAIENKLNSNDFKNLLK